VIDKLPPIDTSRFSQQDFGNETAVNRDRTMKVAEEFEATFLAEMLKHTGLNKTSSEFGGGAGEDAFHSLLTQKYADKLAASGGIGLAQHIYKSLIQKNGSDQ